MNRSIWQSWGVVIALALGGCGGAAKPSVGGSDPRTLEVVELRGLTAHGAKQYGECASSYEELAKGTSGIRQRRAWIAGAGCHALGGAREAALTVIEQVMRDEPYRMERLQQDEDLFSLHAEPRWLALVARGEAALRSLEQTLVDAPLRRELLALEQEDQTARLAWIAADSPAARATVEAIDRKTTARMKQAVAEHGWPGKRIVGEDGAGAAWLLVQHADRDRAFQKQCLALMEPLVKTGEVDADDYAYLHDRLAVAEQRPQRYGTQFKDANEPEEIEDPAHVDERRAAVGLGPMSVYRLLIQQMHSEPAVAPAAAAAPATAK